MTATMIPSELFPIPNLDEETDINPRRVTLINKRNNGLVCLLSRGLEEVKYNYPIENAFVLKMFGPNQVSIGYEQKLVFTKRQNQGRPYPHVNVLNSLSEEFKGKKIPFVAEEEFPSIASGEGLYKKVDALVDIANERLFTYCEIIAKNGFWRAGKDKRIEEITEKYNAASESIFNNLTEAFGGEPDNVRIRRGEILPIDRKLSNFFDDPRDLSVKLSVLRKVFWDAPFRLSMMPISFPEFIEQKLMGKYEERYKSIQDEKEKQAVALGELAVTHPYLLPGLRRAYRDVKAVSNIGMYSLQTLAAAVAYKTLPLSISMPIATLTALSDITMLRNAKNSNWTNYSGIVSSALDIVMRKVMAIQERITGVSYK